MKAGFYSLMLTCVCAGPVGATSLVPTTFDNQVEEAAEIFRGKVTDVTAEWRETERGRVIFSRVSFEVLDRYKGELGATITLEFLGGTIGDESMIVEGSPKFRLNEELVLFVSGDRNRACPLIGWSQGKLDIERGANGEGVVRLKREGQLAASAARVRRVLRADDRMALGEFEGMLNSRVRALDAGK